MKTILIALIVATAPVVASADDSWSGYYVGAQLGFADVSGGPSDTFSSTLGVHAGYLHDFGGYVLGGEISYDAGAEVVSGGSVEKVDIMRAKIKGGHVFGSTLLYGVAGFASMDANAGRADGYSLGVGASYYITDTIIVGAEYLHDTFDTSGADTKSNSLSLRVSYGF